MKEFGMMCKRCLAMFLAVVLLLSSSNIGALLPIRAIEGAEEPKGENVTLGVLIKENFDGLSEEEIAVITSGYLSADKTYSYMMPSDKDDLISVDEKSGTVTAKVYTDPVYKTVWIPVSFDLTNGSAAITGYDDLPMAASGDVYTGTYDLVNNNPGNSFTVEVTYSLDLTMTDEDKAAQKEMLGAAYALAQDIALARYLDAVSVIGEDAELADKIVSISGGLIKDPTKIYADTILEFLAMELEQMGNQSAIDLIYQLVGGIDIPYVEEIDFETGKVVMSEETLRLSSAGRAAATALYNQKKNNGGLDLVKFLDAHGSDNYLKILALYSTELEAALNSNYTDIDYLASNSGLGYISTQISIMLEDFQATRDNVYMELNRKLQGTGKTVGNIAELRALIAELESAGNEAYEAINTELAKLDADTKAALAEYGAPETVKTSADLTALKNAVVAAYKDIIGTINETLAGLDEAVKNKLSSYGAPAKVAMADTSSYDAFTQSGDQDLKDLGNLRQALDAVLQDSLNEANTELKSLLDTLDADVKEKLTNAGAPAAITSVEDVEAMLNALTKVKNEALASINSTLQSIYSKNAQLKQKLIDAGAPATIGSAADVEKLHNALKSVRKTAANAAVDEANKQLTEMHASNGAVMNMMQIPKKIYTENELRELVKRLNTLSGIVSSQVLNDMNEGVAALDELDATIKRVETAKDGIAELESAEADLQTAAEALKTLANAASGVKLAFETVNTLKPYIADVMQAEEQLANTLGSVLSLMHEVEAGLTQLEEGILTLQEKKQQLDMLIMVMQAFCDTVKPVYDAFAQDSWSADKILTEDADYKKLNDWVKNATANEAAPKEKLHVTNAVVTYKMDMYDVTVEFKASVVNPAKVDEVELLDLATKTFTITLTKDATAQDILNEIAAKIDEAAVLNEWGITTENYDRSTSALPEALNSNITYTVTYAPKELTVSFGEGYAAGTADMKVPYGYRLTLPKLEGDVTKEYTYKVNDEANLDQGTVITVTTNTQISREEGAISEKQYLTDLVINTTPGMSDLLKDILRNQALNRGHAISIRVPGKEQVVVTPAGDASSTTITALPYGSRVGDKNWIASEAVIDGVIVNLVDGVHVEVANPGFEKVVVNFELALTAAALGITDEQLLAAMNIPYELVNDYKYQTGKLNALSTNDPSTGKPEDDIMGLLTMLNATDYIMETPSKMTLKEALGKIEDLNNLLGLGLGANAVAAAKKMYDLIPDAGYVALYYTLQQYNEQGIIHYYKNEATYVSQITELNDIMKELVSDAGFIALIPESYMATFELIQKVLNDAAALAEPEHSVNKDLVDVSSSYLSTLLNALAAAGDTELTYYTAAPSELVWVASVEQPGPSKRTVSMTVNFGGVEKTESKIVEFGDTLSYAEMVKWANDMAKALGLTDEIALFYAGSYSFDGDVTVGNDVALSAGWELKSYQVKVDGEVIGEVNYADRDIVLAPSTVPGYQNRYYINETLYSAGTHTLTLAQFKALAEGKLLITKETVNLTEANLIKLVDSMNGAVVLTRDADGNYAIVLPVNPTSVQQDLTGFVIGLFMTEYKYIGLDGKEFYSGQFHIQALLDAFLNSGFGTDSILKLIDANGNITNKLKLPAGTTVLNSIIPSSANNLGGVVLETTMDFGANADETINTKFYITLNGTVSQLQTVRKGLALAKRAGVSFICDNGAANLTVTLPDQVYGAYLAALSMVGQVDLSSINDVDAKIAIGYIMDLLAPIVGDDVSVDTLTNTMNMLGREGDLSAYESYWEALKKYGNPKNAVYTHDTCTMPIENIPINKIVNAMQGYVGKLPLPAGMSVDLTKLIFEYNNPGTEDDASAGLDVTTALTLTNLNTDYAALFLDIKAAGVLNKFGMWTENELLAGSDDFAGTSVVILAGDVKGDLYFNTTTILDLNGKKLTGNIYAGANANLIIIDSAYKSTVPGTVTGKVSGNVTILEGKYETDVSALLDEGYKQNADGRVTNQLYSVVTDADNNVTITINTTPAELKELISKRGVAELAIEMVASLALNNYMNASLSIGGGKIYSININDIVGLYAKGNKLNSAIDTALSWISASDLADLLTTVIGDLTDFAALESGLKGDGKILSYTTSVAPWKIEFVRVADGDYLSMNVGASDVTEDGTVNIVIAGDLQDNMAGVAGTLKDTVEIDVKLDLDDIYRNAHNVINFSGSFSGVFELDFTRDPHYIILMAVVLADNADSTLKAQLVNAIEAFYADTTSQAELEKVFKTLTIKQICDSLRKNARSETFTSQVNGLALKASTKKAILSAIDNSEMGYRRAIDAIGIGLRELYERGLLQKITNVQGTLGGLERTDAEGRYFGYTADHRFTGDKSFRGYTLAVDIDITGVAFKLRLFHTHDYQEIVADKFLKEEATCTSQAVYWKSCAVCGLVHSTETFSAGDLKPHTLVHVAAKPATTTEAGNIEYWYCSVCGKCFSDAEGKNEILDTVIAALPTIGAPSVTVGGLVFGYVVDSEGGILILDAVTGGITIDQFRDLVKIPMTNDFDGVPEVTVDGAYGDLLCTTAKITLTAENADGIKASVSYDIVIIGDTNCNGRVDCGDAVKIERHYQELQSLTGLALIAADCNRNGRLESGDAVKIMVKFQIGENYVTALK